jgi:hypothetical protein
MIEIKDILDQKPIDGQRGDEEFVDPLTDTLPDCNSLAWSGNVVSGHNDTGLRQSRIQLQPTAIEQLNHLIAIDSRHTRCRGMSQHTLDLRMLQDTIASRPRDKIYACLKQLSHGDRVAILPIETN